jgi:UDP-N-acetylmuramate dehydrogenase
MARHTSLKVGGPADLFVSPDDIDDLKAVLDRVGREGIPYRAIGGGSNLLVKDGGIRGCVISLRRLRQVTVLAGGKVEAAAGAASSEVSLCAADHSLSGVEFLCGIPGTFGGAIAMNAGAYGEAILEKVELLTTIGAEGVRVRRAHELEFGYRHFHLPHGEVVVSAQLRLFPGDAAEISQRMAENLAHRGSVQKVGFPNAGSFFRNPDGGTAWRLIDQAGLGGVTVGGAQVSEVHANFLVNRRGDATASDFLRLADLTKLRVKAVTGVDLEEEVRIMGEDRQPEKWNPFPLPGQGGRRMKVPSPRGYW